MNELEFDQALSEYLDDKKCEEVNEVLFELVRAAFTAGWKAAFTSDIGKVMNIDKRTEKDFAELQEEACRKPELDCPP